jgi:glyoxylate/hydroxypyruvate reductase
VVNDDGVAMSAFLFVTPTWDGAAWASHMHPHLPKHAVRVWPDIGKASEVRYAAAWLPPENVLRGLPNLKVIFSLGAGVDAILMDPSLPDGIPIVRVNDPDLTSRMSEHIIMQVLMHHRQQRRIMDNQRNGIWDGFPQHAASAMRVGIMGLGVLGVDAARKLAMLGFNVAGWSRTRKSIAAVASFAGETELDSFLRRTDILVCLLPATAETDGILSRTLFQKLAKTGPLGAPVLINAGRGRHQVEADILASLDAGELLSCSLDVFRKEPLPTDSPFWSHPKIYLTPHSAADSEPAVICAYVAKQIAEFEKSGALQNLVNRARGY